MAPSLSHELHKLFRKQAPARAVRSTRLIATLGSERAEIRKTGRGLWECSFAERTLLNSKQGDLIEQVREMGGTIEREPLA